MMLKDCLVMDSAKRAVGNWKQFDSFSWIDRPDGADDFTIVYTNNRDSSILDESNAYAIKKALEPFMGTDVFAEHHGHWACGWVDGFAIRVFRNGEVTPAFHAYYELMRALEDYLVLDDEDYSQRQLDAIDEVWKWSISRDFDDKVSKHFDVDFRGDRELFDRMADRANEYWEESGDGFWIDVDRIVKNMTLDDIDNYVVYYRVSWIDNGPNHEDYYNEDRAIDKVDGLRGCGLFATYDEKGPG